LQVAGQLHSHEHPRSKETDDDEDEAERGQQKFVQFWLSIAGEIEDDETKAANGEEEGRGETLHDVLTIYSIRKESDLKTQSGSFN
jgi:hypothetical protein